MATRKKKTEKEIINEISTLVAEVTLQDTETVWPKIVKGSHLTVYTFEDGSTKLEWDDEALTRDVREAISQYESQLNTVVKITEEKVKKSRKTKAQ